MLPSALPTASAPAITHFRGSIAHPTRLLCTLRRRCRHRRRNTHYQAGATPYLGRTCTGWIAPASPGAPEVGLAITAFGCCILTSSTMTQSSNAAAVKAGTPAPGTQIVDSTGAVVGNFCGFGCVTRNVNGVWLSLVSGVRRDGLVVSSTTPVPFMYTSSNCSGTAYLDATSIPINGYMVNGVAISGVATTATLYYPATPYQSLLISSSNNGGACQVANPPFMVDAGVATTTPLTVVPPLSIQ